jgi:hypothetical protein
MLQLSLLIYQRLNPLLILRGTFQLFLLWRCKRPLNAFRGFKLFEESCDFRSALSFGFLQLFDRFLDLAWFVHFARALRTLVGCLLIRFIIIHWLS